jgi:hypothetical protein
VYFRDRFERTKNWELVESFKNIKEDMFRSIVLQSCVDEIPDDFSLGLSSRLLKVLLNEKGTPVMINRVKGEKHGYWDHPITMLSAKSDLLFVDLFDWNPYGFLDMSLVMAEISNSENYPDIVGHSLIVELMYTDILVCL